MSLWRVVCTGFRQLYDFTFIVAGNYRLNRSGNSANFSCMFVMGKKFKSEIKELFASTLNRIAATVRFVSFMIVVLIAKLPGWLQLMRNEETRQK